ncbi:Hypothetical protein A7982_06441 [Minicystis rosea]|nr:Hypothetical protein A7982_06441 [Minicystis rosea]
MNREPLAAHRPVRSAGPARAARESLALYFYCVMRRLAEPATCSLDPACGPSRQHRHAAIARRNGPLVGLAELSFHVWLLVRTHSSRRPDAVVLRADRAAAVDWADGGRRHGRTRAATDEPRRSIVTLSRAPTTPHQAPLRPGVEPGCRSTDRINSLCCSCSRPAPIRPRPSRSRRRRPRRRRLRRHGITRRCCSKALRMCGRSRISAGKHAWRWRRRGSAGG